MARISNRWSFFAIVVAFLVTGCPTQTQPPPGQPPVSPHPEVKAGPDANSNPKLTKKNMDRIQFGMSLHEVEEILGSGLHEAPDDYRDTVTANNVVPEFYRWWWNGSLGMVIGFRDGKVVGMSQHFPLRTSRTD